MTRPATRRNARRNARRPEYHSTLDAEQATELVAGPVEHAAGQVTEPTMALPAGLVAGPTAGHRALRRALGFVLGLVLVLGAVTLGAVTLGNTLVAKVSAPHSATIPIPASTPEAIPPPPLPTHSNAPAGLPHQEPVRVSIPRVGIDAKVTKVDLNADGTLKVPPDNTVTGWYSKGPAPGDAGGPPAVIAGHVDSRAGPAVFFTLRQVRPRDRVLIQRADGSTAVFVVYRVAEFPKNSFPAEQVYAPGPRAELRLITCSGTFDYDARSYLSDFVAYAALEPPTSPTPDPTTTPSTTPSTAPSAAASTVAVGGMPGGAMAPHAL